MLSLDIALFSIVGHLKKYIVKERSERCTSQCCVQLIVVGACHRTCIFTEGFFVRNISAPILMLQSYSLLALPILVSIEFEYKGCCFCLAFVAVIRDDQTISGYFASNGHYT